MGLATEQKFSDLHVGEFFYSDDEVANLPAGADRQFYQKCEPTDKGNASRFNGNAAGSHTTFTDNAKATRVDLTSAPIFLY